MEENRSKTRTYVCKKTKVIPDIKEVIKSSNGCDLFINSVTLNPKNVNANLYAHFGKDTVQSFIYAFAIQIGQIPSSSHVSYMLEMNARRVERLCRRREICLSEMESKVIDFCKKFSSLKCQNSERESFSYQVKSELRKLYL